MQQQHLSLPGVTDNDTDDYWGITQSAQEPHKNLAFSSFLHVAYCFTINNLWELPKFRDTCIYLCFGVSAMQQQHLPLPGMTENDTDDYRGFTQSAQEPHNNNPRDFAGMSEGTLTPGNLASSKNLWVSTPDLRKEPARTTEDDNIHTLYGSLLRFPQEDYEAELLGFKAHKRKTNIPGLGLVTKKATAVNARLSQMMSSSKMPTSPQSKYATLPILTEECPVYETSEPSSSSNKNSIIDSESTSESTSEVEQAGSTSANGGPGQNVQKQKSVHKPMFISQSAPIAMLNNNVLGKSHMVISGGEGQINWSDKKALEMKSSELSLLLWQYKQWPWDFNVLHTLSIDLIFAWYI